MGGTIPLCMNKSQGGIFRPVTKTAALERARVSQATINR